MQVNVTEHTAAANRWQIDENHNEGKRPEEVTADKADLTAPPAR